MDNVFVSGQTTLNQSLWTGPGENIGCEISLKHKCRTIWLHVSQSERKISVHCTLTFLFLCRKCLPNRIIYFEPDLFPILAMALFHPRPGWGLGIGGFTNVREDKKYQKQWLCKGCSLRSRIYPLHWTPYNESAMISIPKSLTWKA